MEKSTVNINSNNAYPQAKFFLGLNMDEVYEVKSDSFFGIKTGRWNGKGDTIFFAKGYEPGGTEYNRIHNITTKQEQPKRVYLADVPLRIGAKICAPSYKSADGAIIKAQRTDTTFTYIRVDNLQENWLGYKGMHRTDFWYDELAPIQDIKEQPIDKDNWCIKHNGNDTHQQFINTYLDKGFRKYVGAYFGRKKGELYYSSSNPSDNLITFEQAKALYEPVKIEEVKPKPDKVAPDNIKIGWVIKRITGDYKYILLGLRPNRCVIDVIRIDIRSGSHTKTWADISSSEFVYIERYTGSYNYEQHLHLAKSDDTLPQPKLTKDSDWCFLSKNTPEERMFILKYSTRWGGDSSSLYGHSTEQDDAGIINWNDSASKPWGTMITFEQAKELLGYKEPKQQQESLIGQILTKENHKPGLRIGPKNDNNPNWITDEIGPSGLTTYCHQVGQSPQGKTGDYLTFSIGWIIYGIEDESLLNKIAKTQDAIQTSTLAINAMINKETVNSDTITLKEEIEVPLQIPQENQIITLKFD